MTGLCVYAAGTLLWSMSTTAFSLSWHHSVEKAPWVEWWRIQNGSIVPIKAQVKGHGAGMEPAPDAILEGHWWSWVPSPSLATTRIHLANSGQTIDQWKICPITTVTNLPDPDSYLNSPVCTILISPSGVDELTIQPCDPS